MNIFRRGRSTTGKGTSAFDSPSSSRTQPQGEDSRPNAQSMHSNVQDSIHLPYPAIGVSESRSAVNREGAEFSNPWPAQSSSQRTSSQRAHVPHKPSSVNGFTGNPNDTELYSQNSLDTFIFGAAAAFPSPSSTSTIDPLARPREETDSDEILLYPDTTPRPSVIGNGQPNGFSSPHTLTDQRPPPPSRLQPALIDTPRDSEVESDAKSIRTYGHSSASASVSSLSRPSGSDSRSTSRVSSRSSVTPQTSGNDLTSSEDEEDNRHPIPAHYDLPQPRDSLYLSEEELDIYGDEEDADHEDLQELQFPPTASTARRGSAAIAIPHTPSDRSYNDHRDRDSVSTLRRASKSLDELFTYSFARASGPGSGTRSIGGTAITSVAPSSVPESEVDLENIRKKSLPPIAPTANPMMPGVGMDTLGIDSSWMDFGRTGLVGIDNDEMADIVGESSLGRRQSDFNNFRKGSNASMMRRQSTFSNATVDIIMKNIHQWNEGDSKYQDQKRLWHYEQERVRMESPAPSARERPSISSFFSPRSNMANDTNSNLIAPFLDPRDFQKDKTKDRSGKNWKGMPLDTEEAWGNGWSGRFRVSRKNTATDPTKLQQRLNFQYIRSHNGSDRVSVEGPPVTIHKHSKAVAFSIGRHYRTKSVHKSHSSAHVDSSTRLNPQTLTVTDTDKKKGGMILLAPLHVQVSYTSTTTTRKLESHGLLDDSGRRRTKEAEKLERIKREREREKAKAKERERDKGKEKDRERERDKGKDRESGQGSKELRERPSSKSYSGKGKEKEVEVPGEAWSLWEGTKEKNKLVESRESRSGSKSVKITTGSQKSQDSPSSSRKTSDADSRSSNANPSPASATTAASSTSNSPTTVDPPGPIGFALSQGSTQSSTTSSSQTLVSDLSDTLSAQKSTPPHYDYEDEDDETFDNPRRHPPRTTYREDYATLPPEAFELARQEHQSHRIFPWGRLKNPDKRNVFDSAYNPPWPITQPRYNSETRKYIVEDLNTSFQDVGLLPAIGEVKNPNSTKNRQKKEKPPTNETRVDIFAEVPPDALYMLLPLWPGETDPVSTKRQPFTPPVIPVQKRQYLLVYYKTYSHQNPPPRDGKPIKKRSRNSPTSSYDSFNRQDERYVLLNSFHISARVVSYAELQGTSMRIPDVGLAVSGPLQEAYESMPQCTLANDYVIGMCHSRSNGFEFFPEGFEKMGLSQNIPNPRIMELTTDDDRSSLDTLAVPTPMGRAVMEMAWLGGMALTSFHRDPHWRG
ncbi:hypothetical protein CPB83DRAFT_790307 [Crepidotus variabilis]|uniref:Uncharacterized protein n=1 Tax=Crepidotus variabilis TaxID=179855 RepID=A0A9P6EHP7_9AGAR|nr:hypothetical protein CPB83DRAFT_790307 [Crepidotus variabilis]